ncbi:tyrosine-type recombinase/integrase [Stenotrophomonas maltophilia]|uniref:tyrosine-type recombinase/integrase n=1 Tax=Stenotrophomonas maltophilia TaxID=40324 RepID=UPI0015F21A0B|nr:tyrosine-type recombinase/integrase [Stenotrophomonas maltophilia]QDY50455.1 integrase [Stenotrophomonas maltophilia]
MGRRSKDPGAIPHMRKRPRGKTTYYFFDHGGKPRRETPLGKSYPEAVRKWAELMATEAAVPEIVTFRDAAARYKQLVIPKKRASTAKVNLAELAKLEEFFCNPPAPLAKIRPLHVRQYLDWRTKNGTVAMVSANREKALLSHLWNKCREWGFTDAENPCKGVRGYGEAGRDVYVEDDVYRAVWDAADQPLRDALDLAYLTGQRPSDALSMDRRDVRDGFLHISQSKTKHKLRIAIEGELAELLVRFGARTFKRRGKQKGAVIVHTALLLDEYGQPLSKGQLRSRFDAARARAGVAKGAFQFRDLRAKAGTDKADAAADIRQAQRQLGHSSVVMTETYTRKRKGDRVTPTK